MTAVVFLAVAAEAKQGGGKDCLSLRENVLFQKVGDKLGITVQGPL